MIYRFAPGTAEACTFQIPDAGASAYMVAQGPDIWLGDGLKQRILKLDPSANVFTIWQLTGGAFPKGMAVEANGNLWWADENQPILARLEPNISRMTAYALPVGTQPEMIALRQGKVWYTELVNRIVGVLNPAKASGTSSTLVKTTAPVTPDCSNLGSGTTSTVAASTAALALTANVYQRIVDSESWTVYRLPTNGYPWVLQPAKTLCGLWIKAVRGWPGCRPGRVQPRPRDDGDHCQGRRQQCRHRAHLGCQPRQRGLRSLAQRRSLHRSRQPRSRHTGHRQ